MNVKGLTRGVFLLDERDWSTREQEWDIPAGAYDFLTGTEEELGARLDECLEVYRSRGMRRVYYALDAGELYLAPRA